MVFERAECRARHFGHRIGLTVAAGAGLCRLERCGGVGGRLGPFLHGQIGAGAQSVGHAHVDVGLGRALVAVEQGDGVGQVGQDVVIDLAHRVACEGVALRRLVDVGHAELVGRGGVVELIVRREVEIVERAHCQRLTERVAQVVRFGVAADASDDVVGQLYLLVEQSPAQCRVAVVRVAVGPFARRRQPVVARVGTGYVGGVHVEQDAGYRVSAVVGIVGAEAEHRARACHLVVEAGQVGGGAVGHYLAHLFFCVFSYYVTLRHQVEVGAASGQCGGGHQRQRVCFSDVHF